MWLHEFTSAGERYNDSLSCEIKCLPFSRLANISDPSFGCIVAVCLCLWLVLHFCVVTVSSTGPRKLFKEMTTATSVVLARFPWLLSILNPCELRGPCRHSYFGPRTCGGGENQCHRSGWVLNQGLTFSPLMSTFVFSF